jgi:hypothetical protein
VGVNRGVKLGAAVTWLQARGMGVAVPGVLFIPFQNKPCSDDSKS